MKRKIAAIILAACGLYQISCVVSSKARLSPEGHGIRVDLKNGQSVKGELLSFQERIFYILERSQRPGRIVKISGTDIASVRIRGLRNSNWIPFVFGLEVVPAAILIGTYMSVNNGKLNSLMLLTFLPALLTTGAFVAAESKEYFDDVMIGSDLYIKKYARFPQGLTPDQLDELLRQFGQKEPILIK